MVLLTIITVIAVVFTKQRAVGAFTVTRNSTGDIVKGVSDACSGTRVVRADSTFSHFCATSMTEKWADCDMLIDDKNKFITIEKSDINKTSWTISGNQAMVPICTSSSHWPVVGVIQVQDYPSSYRKPIWNIEHGNKINNTLMFMSSKTKVTFTVRQFFPGYLVRIYFDCVNKNGTSTEKPDKNCVLFKYAGTISYPLESTDVTPKPTRESTIKSSLATMTSSLAIKTPTLINTLMQLSTTTETVFSTKRIMPSTTTIITSSSTIANGAVGAFTVTRNSTGDTVKGVSDACSGTRLVRGDSTYSHFCATSMSEKWADCDMLIDDNNKFITIEKSDLDKTSWTISRNQAMVPICTSAMQWPVVGVIQVQDYPSSYRKPIWNEENGKKINSTIMFITSKNKVTFKVSQIFPGYLLRIYIDCVNENGRRTGNPDKNCVLFKYAGTITYPLELIDVITPKPSKTYTRTSSLATKTPTLINTVMQLSTTTETPLSTKRIMPSSTTITPSTTTTVFIIAGKQTSDDGPNWILIGVLICLGLLFIIILLVLLLVCRRRKNTREKSKVKKAEKFALGQNVSYRDNPAFVVFDVNESKKKPIIDSPTYAIPDKKPIRGTGTVGSPDSTKITSSAYLFLGDDKKRNAGTPASNEKSITPNYPPVQLNIKIDEEQANSRNGRNESSKYNVI